MSAQQTGRQAGVTARPLRADAERTVRAILEAAERVFASEPGATMEKVAEVAGVARTTVHRRFATREALVDALTEWGARQFGDAVAAVPMERMPPAVALYQVTVNVLRVKASWWFAMNHPAAKEHPEAARIHAEVRQACDALFLRAREAGVVRQDADPQWLRRVYYALIHEASRPEAAAEDADVLATRVIDTLLHGFGVPA